MFVVDDVEEVFGFVDVEEVIDVIEDCFSFCWWLGFSDELRGEFIEVVVDARSLIELLLEVLSEVVVVVVV